MMGQIVHDVISVGNVADGQLVAADGFLFKQYLFKGMGNITVAR